LLRPLECRYEDGNPHRPPVERSGYGKWRVYNVARIGFDSFDHETAAIAGKAAES
jgi:hypothetical protein